MDKDIQMNAETVLDRATQHEEMRKFRLANLISYISAIAFPVMA